MPPFEQVHRVSFDHESNLVKTPFSGIVGDGNMRKNGATT
jgi:hypothetical protein